MTKSESYGYCLIPAPAQHEKSRRRMPPWSPESLLSQASSRASSITRTLTFCNPRQRKNLPQPGVAGPRVPRPNAAVPAGSAVKSAQRRRLRAKRGESQMVSKSLTTGWHRRVEAASLDPRPLHSSPLTLCAKRTSDGSHPARPKQKQRAYIQSRPKLLLAVMPHDRQPSF